MNKSNIRLIAIVLIILGIIISLASLGFYNYDRAVNYPGSSPLPDSIAGQTLALRIEDQAAIDEFTSLHRLKFPLSEGAVGIYGEGSPITLWVAGTPLPFMSQRLVAQMRDKIAEGNSPFDPIGERKEGSRTLYELVGLGQSHFYFYSGNLIVWVGIDAEWVAEGLPEILAYYP